MPQAATTPNIIPGLRYLDAPAAIDWLVSVLGFEAAFVVPGDDGGIAHAQLRLGAGMIMLGSVRPGVWPVHSPRQSGLATQGVYICVADIDAHYRRAKSAGAEIIQELQDTDYGSREFALRDPEGHPWSLGTYDPYAPRAEAP